MLTVWALAGIDAPENEYLTVQLGINERDTVSNNIAIRLIRFIRKFILH
jgi:hypothetical protein